MARAVAAYYARGDVFGAQGDFTTAPEISQAFGECLGVWAAVTWQAMGAPRPVVLAEFGPGRGTLMADALRAIRSAMPPFAEALSVHLVEASPALREMQRARVPEAVWHEGAKTLPGGPAILLLNEFLDALPIRQFLRRDGAWWERHVEGGRFVERPSEDDLGTAPEGELRERGEAREAVAAALGARVAAQGGAALILDYGPAESGPGDTLQALRGHRPADPLAEPGTVDLTAHVDFAALARAGRAAGAAAHGPLPMGLFLQRIGLTARSVALAQAAPAQARAILSGAQRLLAPEAMGRLFKALCLCDPKLPTPAGFET
jgi:SAM-dependent MidA family methyltransferase